MNAISTPARREAPEGLAAVLAAAEAVTGLSVRLLWATPEGRVAWFGPAGALAEPEAAGGEGGLNVLVPGHMAVLHGMAEPGQAPPREACLARIGAFAPLVARALDGAAERLRAAAFAEQAGQARELLLLLDADGGLVEANPALRRALALPEPLPEGPVAAGRLVHVALLRAGLFEEFPLLAAFPPRLLGPLCFTARLGEASAQAVASPLPGGGVLLRLQGPAPPAEAAWFEACPIGLARLDGGAAPGALREANEALCRLTGLSRDALRDGGLERLLGPGLEALRRAAAPPSAGTELPALELPATGAEGRALRLRLALAPLPGGGWLLAASDATEAHARLLRLEEACRQAEAANEAKSAFLANMSHEIRTPLNGIVGMTTLLASGELSEEQRGFATSVLRSADLLMAVINDILDIAKLEAGQVELECIPFELADAVEGVVELAAARGAEKGIEVMLDLPSALRGRYMGDPTRLSQVLLNLAGNSVKFTEAGYVLVSLREGEAGLRFSVADTGPGIPQGALPRLFRKFSQADSSITRRFGGSGLGLAICAEIVGLMGGRIGVESGEGQGSCFWFEVPLDRADGLPGRAPEARLAGRRALVVDDLALNRAIFVRQLEELGLTAEAAPGPEEALAVVRAAAARGAGFDVILIDHMMPGGSGIALAARLLGEPGVPARGLVLTSSAGGAFDAAERARFAAVLPKPVRLAALSRALSLAVSGEPAAPARGAPPAQALRELAGRLLIVEDNAVNREVARRLLEQAGFEVLLAPDGATGVATAEAAGEVLDAILMDIEMPGFDGLEAMRRIRALPGPAARLPVIALTAHAMAGTRERMLRAGADGYLSKPFRAEALREAVLSALHAGRAIARALAEPLWDEEIRAELDALTPEIRAELQEAFHEELPRLLARIEEALGQGDAAALRAATHALAGCAASYGARRVSCLARVAEQAAGREDLFAASGVLRALRPLLEAALAGGQPAGPVPG